MANVAQILVDVGLRQLYNSTNNKQRIIFGFQREGDFAFIDVKSFRAGKFIYRYQECLDPGPECNTLMDCFLHFLHFDPVLLIFCQVLSTFHEIFVCR